MNAFAVVYHDIAAGPPPLCIEPELFGRHLESLAASGATLLTFSAFARALREGRLPPRPVCLTFDDGYASVADRAAPLLAEHGLPATVFCVAGYLGRTNDWPSQPRWVERRPLADANALAALAADGGFEIGAHGYDHEQNPAGGALQREIVDARAALEQALGVPVATYAYPYGSPPSPEGRELVRRTYDAACTVEPARRPVRRRPVRAPAHRRALPARPGRPRARARGASPRLPRGAARGGGRPEAHRLSRSFVSRAQHSTGFVQRLERDVPQARSTISFAGGSRSDS